MGSTEMTLEELANSYIDSMPLESIQDKIKDIVTTYYKDNTVTVDIYLKNSFIVVYLEFNDIPAFGINGNYFGKAISEIENYFKILGFKGIS